MKGLPFEIAHTSGWVIEDASFDPTSFLGDDGLELIKERPHRKVYMARDVFLKAYRLNKIELLFKRDPAKKEFEISRLLSCRGRAAEPIAYGRFGSWALFAARRVNGPSLESFMSTEWQALLPREKKEMIEKFSLLLRDLAQLGVFQRDFHLGNIFYDRHRDDFVLIDLQRAELTPGGLHEKAQCEQLRYLFPPFSRYLTPRQILTLVHFIKSWLPEIASPRSRFFIVDTAYRDIRRHNQKKFKRKVAKGFKSEKKGPVRLIMKSREHEELAHSILRLMGENGLTPEGVSGCKVLKDSRHTLCFEYRGLFIKGYRSSGTLKGLSYLVRTPRAIRTWYGAWRLHSLGIRTLRPIFALQGGNPWAPIYGLVAFSWNEDVQRSRERALQFLTNRETRCVFIKSLALFTWDMHQKGVFHGDCKLTNFVIYEDPTRLATFDLDATKFYKTLPDRCRSRDVLVMARSLGRLVPELSHTLQREFLKEYCRLHLDYRERFQELHSRLLQGGK
ncbi:MAG: hypothetical protein GXO58_08480 [Thermodesulfobacteria bacterium]|nr:hypothetical protein [Thermodesulfobacteriota bacterium]